MRLKFYLALAVILTLIVWYAPDDSELEQHPVEAAVRSDDLARRSSLDVTLKAETKTATSTDAKPRDIFAFTLQPVTPRASAPIAVSAPVKITPPDISVVGKNQVGATWEVYARVSGKLMKLKEGDTVEQGFVVGKISPPTLKLVHSASSTTFDISL